MTPEPRFPATVVKVLALDRVVINRGSREGVQVNQRFVLYRLDAEVLRDPKTGEELGHLEMAKGIGRAIHVQERVAIIYNDASNFVSPTVGDLAKPI